MFAFRLASERASERIRAAGDVPTAAILEEALPLDEERRREALIWFAFVGLAPSHPTLAAELDHAYRDIIDRLARRVGGRRRAEVLFAVADGITVQALARPAVMSPARQRAALRAILAS